MPKTIIYGSEAKAQIREGIDAVANAVKVTLGPKGQTVLIDDSYAEGRVTKDGVSVANAIDLKDKVKNAGAKIIKKVASKTAADAGDGTTSATVIAQSIVENGAKLIASGINPMEMKAGMDQAIKDAIKYFKDNSKKVVSADELREIATISANGDSEIGKIVADVINEVGADGVVTVETSKTFDTYVDKVSGLRFDRGFISPYLATDPVKGIAELDHPVILVTDHTISTVKQIQKILEYVAQNGRELLIIANDVQGEALNMLIINKLRGTLKVCAVKCPAFGDRKTKELEDIAILTGATFISQDLGYSLEVPEIVSALGSSEKVTINSKDTTIIGGAGNREFIDNRIEQLRKEFDEETSQYTKDAIKTRMAKLMGGVAILYVGAITEVELNEKKDRIDDALCAARAANEEGTLPGGGTAYLDASFKLHDNCKNGVINGTPDYNSGYGVICKALTAPTTQIVDNGNGEGQGKVVVNTILEERYKGNWNYGYNARTSQYCNLRESGVIDPAKVCRVALENAASIAGMYLTTGCIIVDEPEEKSNDNNK